MKRFILFCLLFLVLSCIKPGGEVHQFEIVGKCKLPGYAKDVDINGSYAYVANDQGGLQIIDISDLSNPLVVGSYLTQRRYIGVSVKDTIVYVASIDLGGLKIFNVANPENPQLLGEDAGWFSAYDVEAPCQDTGTVYIAAGYWFLIENVSNPAFPSYRRRFSTLGNVRSVSVRDSFAFLACEQMGIFVYNVYAPSSSALISWIDTPGNARDVFVRGNYAFVADGYGGLCIIDISRIDSLRIVGRYDTKGYAQGVWVDGNLCYVADREGGLVVLEITEPQTPRVYGVCSLPYVYNVKVQDDYIYAVDRDEGLVILREAK